MITITKDKNILKIEVSGTSGFYALDINNGTFYGKKGSPIKTYPMAKYDLSNAFGRMNTALGSALHRIVNWGECNTAVLRKADNIKSFMGADKVDGLALGVRFDYSPDDYIFINDMVKPLECVIWESPEGHICLSDHYPISLTCEI